MQMAQTARDTAAMTAALARAQARTEEIWQPARAAWINTSLRFQVGLHSFLEPFQRGMAGISQYFARMADGAMATFHDITAFLNKVGKPFGLNLPVWELPKKPKEDETLGHFLKTLAGPWHGLVPPPQPPQRLPRPLWPPRPWQQ
jgi:hypothetical protein